MMYGDLGKLAKCLEATQKISQEPIEDDRYSVGVSSLLNQPATNRNMQNMNYMKNNSNNDALDSAYEDGLDELLNGALSALGGNRKQQSQPVNESIDKTIQNPPKPVAQSDFVNAAKKAHENAIPEKKEQIHNELHDYKKKMKNNAVAYKKYLTEKLKTEDNGALVEAVTKIFDVMFMKNI